MICKDLQDFSPLGDFFNGVFYNFESIIFNFCPQGTTCIQTNGVRCRAEITQICQNLTS